MSSKDLPVDGGSVESFFNRRLPQHLELALFAVRSQSCSCILIDVFRPYVCMDPTETGGHLTLTQNKLGWFYWSNR